MNSPSYMASEGALASSPGCDFKHICNRDVGKDHLCDTTERLPKTNPHIKGEMPLYHRNVDKPLDPTTLIYNNSALGDLKLNLALLGWIGGLLFWVLAPFWDFSFVQHSVGCYSSGWRPLVALESLNAERSAVKSSGPSLERSLFGPSGSGPPEQKWGPKLCFAFLFRGSFQIFPKMSLMFLPDVCRQARAKMWHLSQTSSCQTGHAEQVEGPQKMGRNTAKLTNANPADSTPTSPSSFSTGVPLGTQQQT